MDSFQYPTWNQPDANFGLFGSAARDSRTHEIAVLIDELKELHNLDEKEWKICHSQWTLYPRCKGFIHNERQVIKVQMTIEAPYKKVLAYALYPPYGYRGVLEKSWGEPKVTEYLGGGAAVAYYNQPGQQICCCSTSGRDLVALCGLKLETDYIALFGMKSVEHPSHPVYEGTCRMNMPLIGIYLEQQNDAVHMETYMKDINMGGSIGNIGLHQGVHKLMQSTIELSLNIPIVENITGGEPLYMKFM